MKSLPEYADHCQHCGQPCGIVITLQVPDRYFRRRSDCCGAKTVAHQRRAPRLLLELTLSPDWHEDRGAA
jgi:hypothetical protein